MVGWCKLDYNFSVLFLLEFETVKSVLSPLKSFRVGGWVGGACWIIASALVLILLEFETVKSILSPLKSFRVGGVCRIIASALVLSISGLSPVIREMTRKVTRTRTRA